MFPRYSLRNTTFTLHIWSHSHKCTGAPKENKRKAGYENNKRCRPVSSQAFVSFKCLVTHDPSELQRVDFEVVYRPGNRPTRSASLPRCPAEPLTLPLSSSVVLSGARWSLEGYLVEPQTCLVVWGANQATITVFLGWSPHTTLAAGLFYAN